MSNTTLTPEQREAIYHAWIAALRSGQYKQGQSRLERDGKFCCLGVLCHVLHQRPELGIEMDRFVTPDGTAVYSTPASPRYRNNMPDSSADELGLSTKMPSAEHRAVDAVLVDLNDGNGASFAEIAQYIEDAVMPLLRAKGVLPSAPASAQQEALEDGTTPEKDHENTNKAMTDAPLMMEDREQRDEALLRQALEALKAENERLREVLKDADNELDWLDEEMDTCDHSVGVCMCGYWNMRRKMKAALSKENKA